MPDYDSRYEESPSPRTRTVLAVVAMVVPDDGEAGDRAETAINEAVEEIRLMRDEDDGTPLVLGVSWAVSMPHLIGGTSLDEAARYASQDAEEETR